MSRRDRRAGDQAPPARRISAAAGRTEALPREDHRPAAAEPGTIRRRGKVPMPAPAELRQTGRRPTGHVPHVVPKEGPSGPDASAKAKPDVADHAPTAVHKLAPRVPRPANRESIGDAPRVIRKRRRQDPGARATPDVAVPTQTAGRKLVLAVLTHVDRILITRVLPADRKVKPGRPGSPGAKVTPGAAVRPPTAVRTPAREVLPRVDRNLIARAPLADQTVKRRRPSSHRTGVTLDAVAPAPTAVRTPVPAVRLRVAHGSMARLRVVLLQVARGSMVRLPALVRKVTRCLPRHRAPETANTVAHIAVPTHVDGPFEVPWTGNGRQLEVTVVPRDARVV